MALLPLRDYFQPILEVLAARPEGMAGDALVERVADLAGVSTAERREALANGAPKYLVRVKGARSRLAAAGFVTRRPDRLWAITETGNELLEASRARWQVPGAEASQDFKDSAGALHGALPPGLLEPTEAPLEQVDRALAEITKTVEEELLERLRLSSPRFFERAVLRLLEAMGYGRPEHTGRPGDDGIDGILIADPLGLERVYVQARRRGQDLAISVKEIREFRTSLEDQRGMKGVFITTGSFSEKADAGARKAAGRLELIDGERLVALMIEYGVGVSRRHVRVIPEVDLNFFEGDG